MIEKICVILIPSMSTTYSFFIFLYKLAECLNVLYLFDWVIFAPFYYEFLFKDLQIFFQRHGVELFTPNVVMTACV